MSSEMLRNVAKQPTFIKRIKHSNICLTNGDPKMNRNQKKPTQSRSEIKVMLIVGFDNRGLIHHEKIYAT